MIEITVVIIYSLINQVYFVYLSILLVKIDKIIKKYKVSHMKIKDMTLLKKLEKVGLSDKESLIYASLLELGGAYPSKIAEYTGLNRSTVYMILLQMSVKGIVNEIEKKNKQFYQIEKPSKLVYLLRFAHFA